MEIEVHEHHIFHQSEWVKPTIEINLEKRKEFIVRGNKIMGNAKKLESNGLYGAFKTDTSKPNSYVLFDEKEETKKFSEKEETRRKMFAKEDRVFIKNPFFLASHEIEVYEEKKRKL